MQPNPALPEAGGVKLAANEKEVLLLELFPLVAKNFLTKEKKAAYEAAQAAAAAKAAADAKKAADKPKAEEKAEAAPYVMPTDVKGNAVVAPLPGRVIEVKVKVGDKVSIGQPVVILDAMKMENSITSDYAGVVTRIFVEKDQAVPTEAPMVEIG